MLIKNALKSTFSLEHPHAITPVDGSNRIVSLTPRNEISGHVTLGQNSARTLVLSHFILENAAESDWIIVSKEGHGLQQITKNTIVLDDENSRLER